MSIYTRACEAYKLGQCTNDQEDRTAAINELGNLLDAFGSNDLSIVCSLALEYVGENAHLLEGEYIEDVRAAVSRLEAVTK